MSLKIGLAQPRRQRGGPERGAEKRVASAAEWNLKRGELGQPSGKAYLGLCDAGKGMGKKRKELTPIALEEGESL